MIILITGPSHTGKTLLAQKLMEAYGYPYLSIDHLKMGLIRSGNTALTPEDDEELTAYLWPILREMIKTAIENRQNLIVEGVYIPFSWQEDFAPEYLAHIRFLCLTFSESYIKSHFDAIVTHENAIEKRLFSDYTMEAALEGNRFFREGCEKMGLWYCLIDGEYRVDADLLRGFL